MFLFNLLNDKELEVQNKKNYIFICLKNKRNQLLQSSKYKSLNLIDDYSHLSSPVESEDEKFLRDNLDEFLQENLTDDELILIKNYFFEKKTMTKIAKEHGVSQQAISKKISRILAHLNQKL